MKGVLLKSITLDLLIAIQASLSLPVSSNSSEGFDWTSFLVDQPAYSLQHSDLTSTAVSSHPSPKDHSTNTNMEQNSEGNLLSKTVNSEGNSEFSGKRKRKKTLEVQHSKPRYQKRILHYKSDERKQLIEMKKASHTEYNKKKYQRDKEAFKSMPIEEQEIRRNRKNDQQKVYRANLKKRLGFSNKGSATLHHYRMLEKSNALNEEQKQILEKDRKRNRVRAIEFREREKKRKQEQKQASKRI